MSVLDAVTYGGVALGSVLATLAVIRLRGKAPPDGSRLRPAVKPAGKVSGR